MAWQFHQDWLIIHVFDIFLSRVVKVCGLLSQEFAAKGIVIDYHLFLYLKGESP